MSSIMVPSRCNSTGIKDLWWSSSYSPLSYDTGRDIMDLNVESFEKATGVCCALDYDDNTQYSKSDLRNIDISQRALLPPVLMMPRAWVDEFPTKFVVFLKCAHDTKGYYFGFNLLEIMRQLTVIECEQTQVLINPVTQKPFTTGNLVLFEKKFNDAYSGIKSMISKQVGSMSTKPKLSLMVLGPIVSFIAPFGSHIVAFDVIRHAMAIVVNNTAIIHKGNLQYEDYKKIFGDFVASLIVNAVSKYPLAFVYKWLLGKITDATAKAVLSNMLHRALDTPQPFDYNLYKALYAEERQRMLRLPLDRRHMDSRHRFKQFCMRSKLMRSIESPPSSLGNYKNITSSTYWKL